MTTPQNPESESGMPYQPFVPQQPEPQPGVPYPSQPAAYPGQPAPQAAAYPGQPGPQPAAYPGQPGAYPPAGQIPPAPVKKKGKTRLVVLGVIVALIFGFGIWAAVTSFNVQSAKVGDCLKQTGTDEVEAVKCDDKDAKYKVISIVEDQVEPTDATDPCAAVADADSSYWEGKKGGTGRVLCLAKL